MKHIVFVCVENSCRSQMAEAFGRRHNNGQFAVHSSGSKPSGQVNPRAVSFMAEVGYDLNRHHSKPLEELPTVEYAAVITMGCGDECPMLQGQIKEDWGIADPKHEDAETFRQIRAHIESKVQDLMARLQG